jgi:hypothetical protein
VVSQDLNFYRREAWNFLGYFVWKITILHQKILFFSIPEWGTKIFGVFRVKNHIFSNFRGGTPPGSAPAVKISTFIATIHIKGLLIRKGLEIPQIFSCLIQELKKIRFFGVKSWFFTRNTPKSFTPPSARGNCFKCAPPPNLKSWIRP